MTSAAGILLPRRDQGKEELRFFSGFFYQEMNFFTSFSYPGHMPETGNQQTQREAAEYPTENRQAGERSRVTLSIGIIESLNN